jgi:hypothetical protein
MGTPAGPFSTGRAAEVEKADVDGRAMRGVTLMAVRRASERAAVEASMAESCLSWCDRKRGKRR